VPPETLLQQLRALISEQARRDGGGGGGEGGLPVDLPVRYVEGCLVADIDPRTALRGELALRATQVGVTGKEACGQRAWARRQG
jgi:hypothetical protein